MIAKIRKQILDFTEKSTINPMICGLAIGLYPMLYYYSQNFTLVNSWSQFGMFLLTFILIPMVLCYLIQVLIRFVPKLKILRFALAMFEMGYFLCLLVISTYGIKLRMLALAMLIGGVFGLLLFKHLNKVVVVQFLFVLVLLPNLIPTILNHINYKTEWLEQPDKIVETTFVETPNVYVIQPDGYASFSELKKSTYQFDNSSFESFLSGHGFKLYPDFRSNYFSTLSSNTSMFSMRHHYYNEPEPGANELLNSRELIVGDNAVLKTFKNNGYQTNLLLENPYLLVNRPKLGYDYCNIDRSDIPFLARGFELQRNLKRDLDSLIQENRTSPNFYFIEKNKPSHISTFKTETKGAAEERLKYLKKLQETNLWLEETIEAIETNDPNALVVIVADHGGFVGFDYTLQCKEKQSDPNLMNSIFTAVLAIKWPDGTAPDFDMKLKTNINLFRIIIAQLSKDKRLLEYLQSDASYTVIEEGAEFGVYEVINEEGTVVFNKHSLKF